jgi:hypothetical protein
MPESGSPIELVVDRVAAAVAKAWEAARSERTPISDEEEAGFLLLAYRYLSERQTAIYKLERESHLRHVQAGYQPPPSADELYGEERELSPVIAALGAVLMAALAAGSLFAVVSILSWIVVNIVPVLDELNRFLVSGQAIMLVLSMGAPIVLTVVAERFFRKPLEHVFAGIDHVHWGHFQAHSSKQIESVRAQILMMIGETPGGSNDALNLDPDLSEAKVNAVPVQPGVTEYTFSTGRVKIEDLGNDFRAAKRQHTVVFWVAFTTFILVLISGVAAAILLKQDLKSVGGIGAISGVIGTYSYKILGKARLARIALTLFDSYVIELHQRMDELASIPDANERRRLRAAAWTNFRTGLNKLYALEGRSAARKGN